MNETKEQLTRRLLANEKINKDLGGNIVAILEIRSIKKKLEKLEKPK